MATEKEQVLAISTVLAKSAPRIMEVLPASSTLNAEKIMRMALMEVGATKSLRECEPNSIARACIQAASLGLMVGGLLGEAYLVPFKGKCTLIPGYKGLVKLAHQGLAISGFHVRLVYADDFFDVDYGTHPKITHKPKFDGQRADANIIHGYSVAQMRDGTIEFEVMTRAEVEKRRQSSKAKDDGPWTAWYPEQFKKTVARYGTKLLPASTDTEAFERLSAAIELDNRYDTGEVLNATPLLDDRDSIAASVAEKTKDRTAQLAEQLGGKKLEADTRTDAEMLADEEAAARARNG